MANGKDFNASAPDDTQQRPAVRKQQQQEETPSTPAPRHNASQEVTLLAQRASEQARKQGDYALPDSAKPQAPADVKWVPLPAGGIAALADALYPDDANNLEAMAGHVYDLLTMNRDIVRDDTSAPVHTLVRIPA